MAFCDAVEGEHDLVLERKAFLWHRILDVYALPCTGFRQLAGRRSEQAAGAVRKSDIGYRILTAMVLAAPEGKGGPGC